LIEGKIRDKALHMAEHYAIKVGKVEALSSSALCLGQWFISLWLPLIPGVEVPISKYKIG
jgi:hypothetical protein